MSKETMIEKALELEEIDVNLYRANAVALWKPIDSRGIFGGQVVGLALLAASKTVDTNYQVHSLHSYFLLAGDNTKPILYRVSRIRDGKSYITRTVTARQAGKIIFTCVVSFHLPEFSSLVHQYPMPDVPPPESIRSIEERLLSLIPKVPEKYHSSIRMRLEQPIPIDLRRINPKQIGLQNQPKQIVWMKAKGTLPDDLSFHHCVAAYCSDNYLLNTTLLIHDLQGTKRPLAMITSLDHTIWFHAPFRTDEWLLYEMSSPRTIDGRGLAFGRIFTRDGKLVASTAQEGVIRLQQDASSNSLLHNKTPSKL